MWCKNCNRVTDDRTCELCGTSTDENVPQEVFWCNFCKTPIIKVASELNKTSALYAVLKHRISVLI